MWVNTAPKRKFLAFLPKPQRVGFHCFLAMSRVSDSDIFQCFGVYRVRFGTLDSLSFYRPSVFVWPLGLGVLAQILNFPSSCLIEFSRLYWLGHVVLFGYRSVGLTGALCVWNSELGYFCILQFYLFACGLWLLGIFVSCVILKRGTPFSSMMPPIPRRILAIRLWKWDS